VNHPVSVSWHSSLVAPKVGGVFSPSGDRGTVVFPLMRPFFFPKGCRNFLDSVLQPVAEPALFGVNKFYLTLKVPCPFWARSPLAIVPPFFGCRLFFPGTSLDCGGGVSLFSNSSVVFFCDPSSLSDSRTPTPHFSCPPLHPKLTLFLGTATLLGVFY